MNNIKIFRANRGEGKTKWLAARIKECAGTGGNLYYVGGQATFDAVKRVYESLYKTICPLQRGDSVQLTPDDSFFTDELIDNIIIAARYKPYIVENGCNWYITMSKEVFVDCGDDNA